MIITLTVGLIYIWLGFVYLGARSQSEGWEASIGSLEGLQEAIALTIIVLGWIFWLAADIGAAIQNSDGRA